MALSEADTLMWGLGVGIYELCLHFFRVDSGRSLCGLTLDSGVQPHKELEGDRCKTCLRILTRGGPG